MHLSLSTWDLLGKTMRLSQVAMSPTLSLAHLGILGKVSKSSDD